MDREGFRPTICQLLLFGSRGRNHVLRTCMVRGEPLLHTWHPPRARTCLCCRADEGTRRHSEDNSTVFQAAMTSSSIAPEKPQTSTGKTPLKSSQRAENERIGSHNYNGKQQVNRLEYILPPWGFPSHSKIARGQDTCRMWVRDPSWTPGSSMAAPAWHCRWDTELARADCQGTAWGCSSFGGSLDTCTQVLHYAFSRVRGMRKLLNTVWPAAQKVTWRTGLRTPLPQSCSSRSASTLRGQI